MNSNNKSHLTAIGRTKLPAPTRWLQKNKYLQRPLLDYGCGKCWKINPRLWINYDPFHYAIDLTHFRGSFETVICNYVLCTVPPRKRKAILLDIQSLLRHAVGNAYITVRNDRPAQGWGKSARGTYQGRVTSLFGLPCIHKNSQFRIYLLTKLFQLV